MLDYEAGDPSSIAVSGRTTYWLCTVLGSNLAGYCYQQYRPRLDSQEGNDIHCGLCVQSIVGGDFRRLPTLDNRPLPFKYGIR